MEPQVRNTRPKTAEQRLSRLAGSTHGVVTWEQARRAGVTAAEFRGRVANGYLSRVHRGIYRVGHSAPSSLADYKAATLACGDGCGLSGFAAAHLHRLQGGRPTQIEVTAPGERRVPGIVVHRARNVRLRLTRVRGIPVVTPAWALLDIAGRLDDELLGRACHTAIVRYRLSARAVGRLLDERGPVRGGSRLVRILAGDDPLLLSRLESAFLSLLREEERELPATNTHQEEGYVDCRWPGLGFCVELDSYRFHNSRRSWERDRERDRAARARGEELIRYTWADVVEKSGPTRSEMRARVPRAGERS